MGSSGPLRVAVAARVRRGRPSDAARWPLPVRGAGAPLQTRAARGRATARRWGARPPPRQYRERSRRKGELHQSMALAGTRLRSTNPAIIPGLMAGPVAEVKGSPGAAWCRPWLQGAKTHRSDRPRHDPVRPPPVGATSAWPVPVTGSNRRSIKTGPNPRLKKVGLSQSGCCWTPATRARSKSGSSSNCLHRSAIAIGRVRRMCERTSLPIRPTSQGLHCSTNSWNHNSSRRSQTRFSTYPPFIVQRLGRRRIAYSPMKSGVGCLSPRPIRQNPLSIHSLGTPLRHMQPAPASSSLKRTGANLRRCVMLGLHLLPGWRTAWRGHFSCWLKRTTAPHSITNTS